MEMGRSESFQADPFLPPGYRFHPTDEELIIHYLMKKTADPSFHVSAIAEVDLNKYEPWELPGRAKMAEKECYFFSIRDRKYPTGLRTNRATEAGYWKATGKDREVVASRKGNLVGMKKTLVFYKGRAPKGEKTSWIMHEYRLEGDPSPFLQFSNLFQNEWVLCRVFKKTTGAREKPMTTILPHHITISGSVMCEAEPSLPPLLDSPCVATIADQRDPVKLAMASVCENLHQGQALIMPSNILAVNNINSNRLPLENLGMYVNQRHAHDRNAMALQTQLQAASLPFALSFDHLLPCKDYCKDGQFSMGEEAPEPCVNSNTWMNTEAQQCIYNDANLICPSLYQ